MHTGHADDDLADGRYRDATGAITVTCATDGNHGRSVAWGAGSIVRLSDLYPRHSKTG